MGYYTNSLFKVTWEDRYLIYGFHFRAAKQVPQQVLSLAELRTTNCNSQCSSQQGAPESIPHPPNNLKPKFDFVMSSKLSVQNNASFCHFDNFLKCQINGLDQSQIQVTHYKAQEHLMCLYLLLKILGLSQSRISAGYFNISILLNFALISNYMASPLVLVNS